jgi:phosphoglycolate phosphatase
VIRGVFFDLDGTIIDSFQPITTALNLARAHYNMTPLPVEEAKRYIGGGVERLIREGIGESFVEAGVPLFRSFYAGVHLQETTLFPGVSGTLQALSDRGYHLGVATNKPLRFAREVLDHLDVQKYLPHVIGPEMVKHRKPHREMLDRLMQRTGIRASETLYVGDMNLDIEFARQAGACVWVVTTGCSSPAELRSAEPDKILENFAEIRLLLDHPASGLSDISSSI